MSRTIKLATIVASLALVAAGGLGALSYERVSGDPTPHVAPTGIEQGLWELLPEDDRKAILGDPYPTLFAARPAPFEEDLPLAPSPGSCATLPLSSVPQAC